MGLRMVFFSPKSGLTPGGVVRKKLAFEEIQELLEDGLQGHSGAGRPYLRPTTQTRSRVILVLAGGTYLLRKHPSQHPPPHPSWRRRRAKAERSSLDDS